MKNIHIQVAARLGNFIIQLKNAIQIALYYNYNIIVPEHKFINTTYITINDNVTIDDEKITDPNNYSCFDIIKNIDSNLFNLNREKTCHILKSIFKIKSHNPIGDNDLLIHIRSGDIFDDRPHPEYLMPPLSFYVDIINNNNFDKIYLIAEDRKNPCINKLLELYPNIIFKLQTLEEDIELIVGSTNIILSYGTFIPSLLIFSDKIKNCYKASYMDLSYMNLYDESVANSELVHYKVFDIDLTEYKKKLTPWLNWPEQHEIMLTYPSNK